MTQLAAPRLDRSRSRRKRNIPSTHPRSGAVRNAKLGDFLLGKLLRRNRMISFATYAFFCVIIGFLLSPFHCMEGIEPVAFSV
ncbi:hypothetical protein M440DRAFT_1035009 [Trichoderma longibrachiatum ATCC 18648]|uniref:Uncharacterized protein n=1 Tax=Trichoderma longibrachiatum ATCC 18648 TaxID=983965 RepID=A0A2T4BZX4_TRILO|nr:hypothetical protein M440DRAFT_1035009 [Trichoderma longibrachiatum ATCC 18648]